MKFSIWILAFLTGAGNALACVKNANDPFAIEATMTAGPFRGQCIDTDKYRSGMRLTDEQKRQFFTETELLRLASMGLDPFDDSVEVMANFAGARADGREHHYVAVIPKEKVQASVMQIVRLSKILPVKHGQIRLELSKEGRPAVLIDQTVNRDNREMKLLNDDIVMAISGVHPVDHEETYHLLHGAWPGYYSEEYQIGSHQNLALGWIKRAGLTLREYRLNFSKDQSQRAFSAGLDVGTKNGISSPYAVLTSSCLNIAFLVFYDVLHKIDVGFFRKALQSVFPSTVMKLMKLINADGSSFIQKIVGGNLNDWDPEDTAELPEDVGGEVNYCKAVFALK